MSQDHQLLELPFEQRINFVDSLLEVTRSTQRQILELITQVRNDSSPQMRTVSVAIGRFLISQLDAFQIGFDQLWKWSGGSGPIKWNDSKSKASEISPAEAIERFAPKTRPYAQALFYTWASIDTARAIFVEVVTEKSENGCQQGLEGLLRKLHDNIEEVEIPSVSAQMGSSPATGLAIKRGDSGPLRIHKLAKASKEASATQPDKVFGK